MQLKMATNPLLWITIQMKTIKPAISYAILSTCLAAMLACGGCRAADKSPASETPRRITIEDAQLGPGDEIEIQVYREPDLNRTITIPGTGVIFMPLVGEIDTRLLSANNLRTQITEKLKPYLVNPQVNVEIKIARSQKVIVLGEVARPGIYSIYGNTPSLEAVALAGGFTLGANTKQVVHLKQNGNELKHDLVDMNSTLTEGDPKGLSYVQGGDILYVPPNTITNMVRFANNIERLLRPVLMTQQGILLGFDIDDAFSGDRTNSSTTIVIPATQ